ncbi:MAG: 2-oxoglutarate dehydrogenase E1 component, partial [Chitinophagaceae bacterium]|nr:2-oxoglutarate dehydrogenase E1 component [Chitinophagaceae bacterium]
MKDFSFITNSHPSAIEDMYHQFVANPENIDPELKKFFEGFDFAMSHATDKLDVKTTANTPNTAAANASIPLAGNLGKEFAVYQLIRAYRKRGHLVADTNPIKPRKDRKANLALEFFGLSDADLQTQFQAGKALGLGETATLEHILSHLKKVYTSHVGLEYTYINNKEKYDFIEKEFD